MTLPARLVEPIREAFKEQVRYVHQHYHESPPVTLVIVFLFEDEQRIELYGSDAVAVRRIFREYAIQRGTDADGNNVAYIDAPLTLLHELYDVPELSLGVIDARDIDAAYRFASS